ncbi:MAG TPA: LCP family protein, partial [Clostridia bacterium]|nr:LCP family protein [Clostridia bacterium]
MNNPKNSGSTPEELNAQASGAPKRGLLKKALIGGALILGAAVLAGVLLFTSLLSRISKPGTTVFAEDIGEDDLEDEVQPQTPAKAEPTPKPVLAPAASPNLTPEPEPLPLSELYPQSRLSQAQLEAIKAQNANTKEFVNVLVVGVDRRGSRGEANADVIIIASLDKRHGRLKLVSVLRDLYVPIEGYESGRINSAAAKGGMQLLLKTVNDALQMDIKNYIMLDFYMFERVIDELGGVTVRMSEEEISAANDNIAGLNKQRNVEYL